MAHDVAIEDWHEPCLLQQADAPDRTGPLVDLVLIATRLDPGDRPQQLLVSGRLGELDDAQIEALRHRPDFPGI